MKTMLTSTLLICLMDISGYGSVLLMTTGGKSMMSQVRSLPVAVYIYSALSLRIDGAYKISTPLNLAGRDIACINY